MSCAGNEYFGVRQTLFLGCSVASFSASASWNEQVSEVTVSLYQDPCGTAAEYPKYFYDTYLDVQTTTEADPGFLGEMCDILGMPAYFRVGTFEFCGIIQSWEKSRSQSANPQYIVKLVSPVKILEDTQLITSKYSGPVLPQGILSNAPHNLINLYGFLEGIDGTNAPEFYQDPEENGRYLAGNGGVDGPVFGTSAGRFGGANINSNGVKWNSLKNAISALTSSVPLLSNNWCPHGRVTHRGCDTSLMGAPWSNSYGLMPFDGIANGRYVAHYCVDISELPNMPDYYRINSDSISLLEIISKICQEAGFDYFVELLPIRNYTASANGVVKLIKIRTVSRVAQPIGGQITAFVENALQSNRLISSSIGQELRSDVTSSFLFGAPKETIYQAYQNQDPDGQGNPLPSGQSAMIVPYFGQDSYNNMIVPRYNSTYNFWEATFETFTLESQLLVSTFNSVPINISEGEMGAALTSFEEWDNYIKYNETDTFWALEDSYPGEQSAYIHSNWDFLQEKLSGIKYLKNPGVPPRQWPPIVSTDFVLGTKRLQDLKREGNEILNRAFNNHSQDENTIYNFVQNIASQYYGKAWAVRVPQTAAYLDEESNTVFYSEEPGQDGGWTEVSDVLGIPNGSVDLQFFSNAKNKILPFLAFDGLPNLELFADEDSLTVDSITYLKCTPQDSYVFADRLNLTLPRVVLTVAETVVQKLDELVGNLGGIENFLSTTDLSDEEKRDLRNHLGTTTSEQISFYKYLGLSLIPYAAAIPIKSNVQTYGPWSTVGPPGGIHIEQSDGLAPWEYGGYDIMNTAANTIVAAGLTNMQVSEVGSVTLAGYPELPLGAEINAGNALNGQHLFESRTNSYGTYSANFNGFPFNHQYITHSYGFSWAGNYGPNISNITINVGDSVTTTYNMQTFTPKFGSFSNLNASRLKQVGQNRLEIIRRVNNIIAQNSLAGSANRKKDTRAKELSSVNKSSLNERKKYLTKTPHQILVGEIYYGGGSGFYSGISGLGRTQVATYSAHDVAATYPEYEKKSYMSLEGLIRPFSLAGEGGLPRYPSFAGTGSGTTSNGLVFKTTTGNVIVGTGGASTASLTLYDLNPYVNPSGYQFSQLASRHTGTLGHDFEILGRGTGFPTGGILMLNKESGARDYRNDYRPFALRGPLVIQSWGYDLEGKPVPNQVDTSSGMRSGIYATSGLSNNFYPDFALHPETWVTAPLELKFDRARGLWVAPTNEQIVNAVLLGHLGYNNSVAARLTDTGTWYFSGTTPTGYSIISGWSNNKNLYASGCELEFKYNAVESKWIVNSDSELNILVTGTVAGSTWNRSQSGFFPTKFSACIFESRSSGLIAYNTGVKVTGWNEFTEGLTPGNGYGYIATLKNGWLQSVDCRKVQL